jgi:hypothetical protein
MHDVRRKWISIISWSSGESNFNLSHGHHHQPIKLMATTILTQSNCWLTTPGPCSLGFSSETTALRQDAATGLPTGPNCKLGPTALTVSPLTPPARCWGQSGVPVHHTHLRRPHSLPSTTVKPLRLDTKRAGGGGTHTSSGSK